jgi:hypothetical protein
MLNMVDKQSLPDNSVIEIETSSRERNISTEKKVREETFVESNDFSEEEALNELETDTEDLKNMDGVIEND